MKFGRLLVAQANPAWQDYYISYKTLRTLIKRMVFAYHAGSLGNKLVQFNPTQEPVQYPDGVLIPPKIPDDDSDDGSGDDDVDLLLLPAREPKKKKKRKGGAGGQTRGRDQIDGSASYLGLPEGGNSTAVASPLVPTFSPATFPTAGSSTGAPSTAPSLRKIPSEPRLSGLIKSSGNAPEGTPLLSTTQRSSFPPISASTPEADVSASPLARALSKTFPNVFSRTLSSPSLAQIAQQQSQQPQQSNSVVVDLGHEGTSSIPSHAHGMPTAAGGDGESASSAAVTTQSHAHAHGLGQGHVHAHIHHKTTEQVAIENYESCNREFWRLLNDDFARISSLYAREIGEIIVELARLTALLQSGGAYAKRSAWDYPSYGSDGLDDGQDYGEGDDYREREGERDDDRGRSEQRQGQGLLQSPSGGRYGSTGTSLATSTPSSRARTKGRGLRFSTSGSPTPDNVRPRIGFSRARSFASGSESPLQRTRRRGGENDNPGNDQDSRRDDEQYISNHRQDVKQNYDDEDDEDVRDYETHLSRSPRDEERNDERHPGSSGHRRSFQSRRLSVYDAPLHTAPLPSFPSLGWEKAKLVGQRGRRGGKKRGIGRKNYASGLTDDVAEEEDDGEGEGDRDDEGETGDTGTNLDENVCYCPKGGKCERPQECGSLLCELDPDNCLGGPATEPNPSVTTTGNGNGNGNGNGSENGNGKGQGQLSVGNNFNTFTHDARRAQSTIGGQRRNAERLRPTALSTQPSQASPSSSPFASGRGSSPSIRTAFSGRNPRKHRRPSTSVMNYDIDELEAAIDAAGDDAGEEVGAALGTNERAPLFEHRIRVAATVPEEQTYGAVLALYERMYELKLYCGLNLIGFRKILKKVEKYSPKVQTAKGMKVSIVAPLCAEVRRRVAAAPFAQQKDLQAATEKVFAMVSREKLLAVESKVNALRAARGHQSGGVERAFKSIPLLVSWVVFALVLLLPLDFHSLLDKVEGIYEGFEEPEVEVVPGTTVPMALEINENTPVESNTTTSPFSSSRPVGMATMRLSDYRVDRRHALQSNGKEDTIDLTMNASPTTLTYVSYKIPPPPREATRPPISFEVYPIEQYPLGFSFQEVPLNWVDIDGVESEHTTAESSTMMPASFGTSVGSPILSVRYNGQKAHKRLTFLDSSWADKYATSPARYATWFDGPGGAAMVSATGSAAVVYIEDYSSEKQSNNSSSSLQRNAGGEGDGDADATLAGENDSRRKSELYPIPRRLRNGALVRILKEKTDKEMKKEEDEKKQKEKVLDAIAASASKSTTAQASTITPVRSAKEQAQAKRAIQEKISWQAHKCLALLVWAAISWVTEAVPYYCTALLIPPLVVMLGIAVDGQGNILAPKAASQFVASHMFNHTSFLILLGFAISACFCKAQLELRIASALQGKYGKDPAKFILAVMLLGLFLSAWLNNHTGPILCVSFLTPIMSDIGPRSNFNRCLLLGLAFACNVGGMATPFASLQNILSLSNLAAVGIEISFGSWMLFSVPFCTILTVISWFFVVRMVPPDDVTEVPELLYEKRPLGKMQYMVIAATLIAVAALALMRYFENIIGGVAVLSMMFMFFVFSTGILTLVDLNSFNWHLLILIGGGAVLGGAIKSSRLLDILASGILGALRGGPLAVYFQLVFVVTVLTSCISHTIGALILMPLLVQIGLGLGIPTALTLSCGLAISGAQALPFSSFPNLNTVLVRNDMGESYVKAVDIMKGGIPLTLVCYVFIVASYPFLRVYFPNEPTVLLTGT